VIDHYAMQATVARETAAEAFDAMDETGRLYAACILLAGMTLYDVADAFGVSHQAVSAALSFNEQRIRHARGEPVDWPACPVCGGLMRSEASARRPCADCQAAAAELDRVCPDCGGPKSPRVKRCRACAELARYDTCPFCGKGKDRRADLCRDCRAKVASVGKIPRSDYDLCDEAHET
jgi:hypothetical protein